MCLPADTLVFSERISHRPNKFSNFVSQALEQTIVQKESSFKESLSNVSAENAILGYSDWCFAIQEMSEGSFDLFGRKQKAGFVLIAQVS